MSGATADGKTGLNEKYRTLAGDRQTLTPLFREEGSEAVPAGQEPSFASSLISRGNGDDDGWPPLGEAAFHGLAGEVVRSVDPHTEADPAGVLLTLLAAYGNACGAQARAIAGDAPHPAKLNVLLIGQSSRARKGTAGAVVRSIMATAYPEWARDRVMGGLSSGEGLLTPVDDSVEVETIEGNDVEIPKNPDKRLMIVESEFGRTLTVMAREQNTLASIIREAWDGPDLRVLNRSNPLVASGTHISIVGHITRDELLHKMTNVDLANGFANRFLFALVRQTKLLPDGGNVPSTVRNHLASKVRHSLDEARRVTKVRLPGRELGELRRTDDAVELWREVYASFGQGAGGILGAVTARPAAQVLRLSVVYALLDGTLDIDVPHIEAALAIWRYCEDSARYVFGNELDDPTVATLREHLKRAGEQGMTKTDINNAFGRKRKAHELADACATLAAAGLAKDVEEETGGRPVTRWYFTGELAK